MRYFEKANDLYYYKEYRTAIKMYKKSLDLKENEVSCLYNSSVCFIKLKEYKSAIPLLEEAIKLKYESKYFFNLAYCYAMLQDYKKSLIYFNKAWCLNSRDSDCEKAISIILKSLKK